MKLMMPDESCEVGVGSRTQMEESSFLGIQQILGNFIFLSLNFLIYKMETIRVSHRVVLSIKCLM